MVWSCLVQTSTYTLIAEEAISAQGMTGCSLSVLVFEELLLDDELAVVVVFGRVDELLVDDELAVAVVVVVGLLHPGLGLVPWGIYPG